MADTDPTIQTPPAEPAPQGQGVTEPVAAPVAEKASLTFSDKVKELGFENVADDNEAVERLITAYKHEKAQREQFGPQLEEALNELRASRQPEARQPEFAPEQPSWKPPKLDKALVAPWRNGDAWKDGTPENVKQHFTAWQNGRAAFAESFMEDPEAALDPMFDKRINEAIERKFGKLTQEQREQQIEDKILTENAWLWEIDPVGGKPKIGQMSAEGQLLNEQLTAYQQSFKQRHGFFPAFEHAWDYAHMKYQLAKLTVQSKLTTDAKAAQEANDEQKRKLLLRAGGTPNRAGSLPLPSEGRSTQRNRAMTAGERFKQNAERQGLALNH